MIKIINNFNCKIVFSKTYGRLFKLPFQSMISYGSSKAVYYKNNYEINCMNGLNLDLVDSKTVSQSIKSIFDRYEHKNYINLYENDIDNNMNMIINEFNCKEYIDDINFHVAIETDIRVINKDELIMEDAVELLSIIPVVSIIKDGKVLTKTFKSMCRLEDGFEKAFMSVNLKKPTILFVDGIDARPRDIDNEQYFECLVGLVNAVLEMNQSFLKEKQIKIMLLIRPDIMYKMPVHNMNQKLRNNSVLLNWVTSYRKYIDSKLFKIADDYFMKQQDYSYELGECWNYYFPYKVEYQEKWKAPDNPFVEFLRYSLYKPRDILTMLNEMVDATSGTQFKHSDFEGILSNYSTYLKGELKDYMLIYMDDSDYNNFSIFFDYFQGHRNFNYKFFEEKHLEYIKYLRELGRKIPPFMETASEALQLLYDTNIICYKIYETLPNGKRKNKMFWSYKERNYANMQPEVKKGGEYSFHMAYARAFRLF